MCPLYMVSAGTWCTASGVFLGIADGVDELAFLNS
jgi:hypothetical protein